MKQDELYKHFFSPTRSLSLCTLACSPIITHDMTVTGLQNKFVTGLFYRTHSTRSTSFLHQLSCRVHTFSLRLSTFFTLFYTSPFQSSVPCGVQTTRSVEMVKQVTHFRKVRNPDRRLQLWDVSHFTNHSKQALAVNTKIKLWHL
jgi:hypothetical protein